MATDKGFIDYVLDQLRIEGVTAKKMFGEYMVYYGGKGVFLVCDNRVMIKMHDFLAEYNLETDYPYKGARLHYVLDADDADFLTMALVEGEKVTPLPKPKKKKI